MIKHPDQRVAVFIDVSNMYHSAKNLFGRKLNFKEVLKTAVAGRKLIRAIAYAVRTESGEEKAFLEALDKQGFEVKMKDLQIFAGGAKKADWDVGLAIDAIKIAERIDVVVLVSGDGDYQPLINYLQENKGCLVEVIAFEETSSKRLVEQADDFVNLSENKSKFLLRSGVRR
jgi:uncharacterized protein (TIGR00288 family)